MDRGVLLSFETVMTSVIKIRAQRKKMENSIKLRKGQLHEKWKNRLFLYFCTFPTLISALFPLYGPYFSGQLKQSFLEEH